MLEASIQVSLSAQKHYVLKVSVVDMGVNSEEPFENHLDDVHEILRKWYAKSTWENFLVI